MKKIVSLFQRNYEGDRLVRNEIVPGAEWVLAGEGVATRKWDGTCCLVRDGKLLKRYEVKPGKLPPPNFEPANDVDENTGKQQGWMPTGAGPEDEWHRVAYSRAVCSLDGDSLWAAIEDGTYELCGPKVQGNLENFAEHVLVKHGTCVLADCPRDFEALREYLRTRDIEGVVWHHPDGRMVKIKGRDFGIKRGR